jgi:hypothetical protein
MTAVMDGGRISPARRLGGISFILSGTLLPVQVDLGSDRRRPTVDRSRDLGMAVIARVGAGLDQRGAVRRGRSPGPRGHRALLQSGFFLGLALALPAPDRVLAAGDGPVGAQARRLLHQGEHGAPVAVPDHPRPGRLAPRHAHRPSDVAQRPDRRRAPRSPSIGVPAGLGIYLAWMHRDWSAQKKHRTKVSDWRPQSLARSQVPGSDSLPRLT